MLASAIRKMATVIDKKFSGAKKYADKQIRDVVAKNKSKEEPQHALSKLIAMQMQATRTLCEIKAQKVCVCFSLTPSLLTLS